MKKKNQTSYNFETLKNYAIHLNLYNETKTIKALAGFGIHFDRIQLYIHNDIYVIWENNTYRVYGSANHLPVLYLSDLIK